MPSAADKKRWDDLHAAQAEAIAAKDEFEQGIWRVYGGSYQPSWLKKGERTKLEALNARIDKIGDKIIDLLVRVSPRGEAWLSGVPAHWIRRDLTWEDAIRPEGEPLSVDVPQAWGSNRKFTEENVMSRRVNESGGRRNLESTDAAHFREFLEKNVVLVGGEAEGSIDTDDPDPVYVVIVVDVNGYGPHQGAIYAKQNRFHPGHHGPLEAAHEILEDFIREHYGNGTEDDEALTETFDAVGWKLKPKEFADAIAGTKAAEYIDVHSSKADEGSGRLEESSDAGVTAKEVLAGLGPYMEHEGLDAPKESARIARLIAGAGHNHDRVDKVLEEVNRLVGGHGIEAIQGQHVDNYYFDTVALYVNMGDTYSTTLLYDTRNHQFYVTSWGDWVEQNEQNEQSEDFEESRTMNAKPKNHRKAVADTIEDLKGQLANYDHGPGTFPDLIFRILASAPQGGEEFEDVGYEPFQGLGWHEWTLLTEVLEVIENREDVEAFAQGLLRDGEEEGQLEEARRRPRLPEGMRRNQFGMPYTPAPAHGAYPYAPSPSGHYILTRDGQEIMRGTEQEIWKWMHMNLGYSVDHALQHEGYKMLPVVVEESRGRRPSRRR